LRPRRVPFAWLRRDGHCLIPSVACRTARARFARRFRRYPVIESRYPVTKRENAIGI
jgi:hypothetical protein